MLEPLLATLVTLVCMILGMYIVMMGIKIFACITGTKQEGKKS